MSWEGLIFTSLSYLLIAVTGVGGQVVERQSKKVFHSESFFEISKDTLSRVLRLERLSVHEIDVFRACLHWAERRASLLNLALTPANKRMVSDAVSFRLQLVFTVNC